MSLGKHPAAAAVDAAKILPPQLRTGDKRSTYYANNDFESVFVEEFLSHEKARNDSIAKADLLKFANLPGSTVHPHAEKHLIRKAKNTVPSPQPGHERHHLIKRGKALFQRTKTDDKPKKGRFTPYIEANSKIARILQRTKPKGKGEDMQASQLNDYYKLVTKESTAAILLQSQYRRILATNFAKRVAHRRREATRIQSFVRCFYARKLLKHLKVAKQNAADIREQCVRLFVARSRRRKIIRFEHNAAVICQCAIRVHAAKQATNIKRRQLSWEVNQQRWRKISIRLAWAILRLNYHARTIQCIVRRKLAHLRVWCLFDEYTESVILIQSCFRRFVAQKYVLEIIYQLSVDERCSKIRIIQSEYEYWKVRVEELLTKPSIVSRKKEFESRRVSLEKERCEKYEQIHALESHYRDQLQFQSQLTPRAIGGGWGEQLSINLKDTRERITTAKLDLFFVIEKKLKSVVKELNRIQSDEDEAMACLEHWKSWHEDELNGLWQYQREHDSQVEKRERMHAIINEQMLWQVKFTVPSGMPDKRRPLLCRENDSDGQSFERVTFLANATKEIAVDRQAAAHLANTYQPFQQMHEIVNALPANAFQATKQGWKEDEARTIASSLPNFTSPNTRQRISFPSKLPWNLLDKVRDERKQIDAEFDPEH